MTDALRGLPGAPAMDRRKLLRYAAAGVAAGSAASLLDLSSAPSASAATGGALPDYLPVPKASVGPALNADGYYVGKIKGNLFWVTDGIYQTMFLTTRTGVVLVDAPPGIGHNLFRAIEEVTRANGRPQKVTHQIYSHFHEDHLSGSALFNDVKPIRIAHSETKSLLKFANDPNRPLPDITFDDSYVLEVGGERLELRHHGPNHTEDNLFIYAPEYKTLMLVDVFFPGWSPFLNLAITRDVPHWIAAHDIAMTYPWETLVSGHVTRLGTRADAALQKSYVDDLMTFSSDALNGVDATPFVQKYLVESNNPWAMGKEWFDEMVRQTVPRIVSKYGDKLAGIDAWAESHAIVMLESLRVDYGSTAPFGIHA